MRANKQFIKTIGGGDQFLRVAAAGKMAMDRRSSSSTIATVLVLCSALASCNAAGGLPRPAPPAVFNVVSFGAKPGNTDSAQVNYRIHSCR